jgi:hypothetical protein
MPGSTLIAPFRPAMAGFATAPVRGALKSLLAPDAVIRLCHAFGTPHRQIGSDPLGRMRQVNRARPGFDPESGEALP